jgi:hypothetical protein
VTVVRPRRTGALALTVVGALLLVGCGSMKAGSAAVVGDNSLPESSVSDSGQEILDIAANNDIQAPATADLNARLVGIWVETQLTDALAAQEGVSVTAGDVDTFLSRLGDLDVLQIAVSAGIVPSALDQAAKTQLLQQQLALRLAPNGTPEEQGAALREALAATGAELGVSVNPRYATYDAATALVGARSADGLSKPEPQPSLDTGGGTPLAPPAG